MSRLAVLSLALVLLLVVLPLTSFGATRGQPMIWWLGLLALVIGGLLPPATRFGLGREPDE